MVVKDIMKKDVATCAPEEAVASAMEEMRRHDCGFLPVVDSHGIAVGVMTDRDACLAGVGKHRTLARVAVKEAMSHPVFSCFPDDNVKAVLAIMAKHRVRRLAVLSRNGRLEGVLSIDDIVSAPPRRGGPSADEIVAALRGICSRRPIEAVTA